MRQPFENYRTSLQERLRNFLSPQGGLFLFAVVLLPALFVRHASSIPIGPDEAGLFTRAAVLLSVLLVLLAVCALDPKAIPLPASICFIVCGIIGIRMLDYNVFRHLAEAAEMTDKTAAILLASRMILTICFLLGLLLIGVGIAWQTHAPVENFFLAMVIPLSIIFLLLFVPWSQPDTQSHMRAVYRLSNMLLGYPKEDLWMGRKEDCDFLKNVWSALKNPSLADYLDLQNNFHIRCTSSEPVPLPEPEERMAFYSLVNYLPQVLGFTLGRLLGLGTVLSIYFGRIAILLFYIIVIYRDIKKIPAGKWILATVALLPMSLMMSSAISYDTMVIIASLSFLTCVLRLLNERGSKTAYMEALIWAFVLGAVKGGGYLILLPLTFVLFDRERKKESLRAIGGLLACGLVSILLFDVLLAPGTAFQFGTAGGDRLSAAFALQRPLTYLDMATTSYLRLFDRLAINTGGTWLAWLEETIPYAPVVLFMLVGGIEAIFERDEIQLKEGCKWLCVLIILLGLVTTPAMLLSWTRPGMDFIDGMQGRYFLPLLPLFYYAVTKFSLHTPDRQNGEEITGKGVYWMVGLSCLFVYYLLALYLTR